MDFLSIFKKKKEKKDFFFALLFKPYSVGSILFEETAGKLSIVATKQEQTKFNVEKAEEEELLEVCDRMLSALDEHIPENILVKKTIFGIPFHWTQENKIKAEYLVKFKKICSELDLNPIGFIVSIEAIVHYLNKKEGAPISAIFVEIIKDYFNACLVRAGKIVNFKHKYASEDLLSSIKNILKEVSDDSALPSRIILLESDGIEIAQQELLSYPWNHHLSFLHFPKIIIFEKGWENEAIINGVATQMGFDVPEDKSTDHLLEDEGRSKENNENEDDYGKNDFPSDFVVHENFGFLTNRDILEDGKHEEKTKIYFQEELQQDISEKVPENKKNSFHFFKKILTSPQKLIFTFLIKLKKPAFPLRLDILFKTKFMFILFAAVLLTGVFIYYYYANFLKADVVFFLDKREINKSFNLTLASDKDTSVKDSILKIGLIKNEKEGEVKNATTGKKEIGDEAKGEITIYNKTEQKKTFSKGTVVIGANRLQFELSDDVSVASTSAFSTTFSNVKAKVTASDFGPQYNLPSDTNFSFKDFSTSDFFAKNENAFSGGTKEEISAVSKKDLDDAQNDILKTFGENALDDLKSKIGNDDVIVPFVISNKFIKKEFSKKEGDEAKEITLKAEVEFTGAYYNKKEIDNFKEEIAKEEIPQYFHFDEKQSSIDLKNIEMKKDNSITGVLDVHSVFVPDIETKNILKKISGKNTNDADKVLKDLKGISDYKIIFKNNIDFFPGFLPFNQNNIQITTKING